MATGEPSARWSAMQAHRQAAAKREAQAEALTTKAARAEMGDAIERYMDRELRLPMGPPTGYVDLENVQVASLDQHIPQAKAEKQEQIQAAVKAQNQVFLCEVCNKQYTKISEYENHLSSYDHHHRKRLKDLKALSARHSKESKKREKEEKQKKKKKKKGESDEDLAAQKAAALSFGIIRKKTTSTGGAIGGGGQVEAAPPSSNPPAQSGASTSPFMQTAGKGEGKDRASSSSETGGQRPRMLRFERAAQGLPGTMTTITKQMSSTTAADSQAPTAIQTSPSSLPPPPPPPSNPVLAPVSQTPTSGLSQQSVLATTSAAVTTTSRPAPSTEPVRQATATTPQSGATQQQGHHPSAPGHGATAPSFAGQAYPQYAVGQGYPAHHYQQGYGAWQNGGYGGQYASPHQTQHQYQSHPQYHQYQQYQYQHYPQQQQQQQQQPGHWPR
ncbi:uncharacterized protein MONBRDRAFT_25219 [Monosiga brevicollis MX1]|uniref:C2H2-type domain-containing protein n=1 Tax=Monosiga brevicollis TaxID=81824 RepID=A9UYR8_MONBE|nr:uncharacterized protein MONBRDRAFT_25219 [Monosiga brevicollis MX1]EDQ89510.1 predicted protein [Monosiga brevicollis MX1]|eukprot:XP_001745539.1 hypothetical protein [Monosiga brevicollis MX1]